MSSEKWRPFCPGGWIKRTIMMIMPQNLQYGGVTPPPPPPPHTHTHTHTHEHTRTIFVGLYSLSGTRSRDVSKSREIECSNYRILLTFDKRLYNIAAVRHAKVYDDQTTLSRYLKVFQISQNLWEILHAKMLHCLELCNVLMKKTSFSDKLW